MSGTVQGGKKAAATNLLRHGKNFYKQIGSVGGRNGKHGGFASDKVGADGLTGRERAKVAGAKGGSISRRGTRGRTKDVLDANREEIINLYEEGVSLPQISKKIDVSYATLLDWAKENIPNYGEKWEFA